MCPLIPFLFAKSLVYLSVHECKVTKIIQPFKILLFSFSYVCYFFINFALMHKKVAIIGGGAAGCFCSIELKRILPDAEVHVFEGGTRLLAKVAVTGGGRCNLTNSFASCLDAKGRLTNLQSVYPRGDKLMRKMLSSFSHEDTWQWFEREGVRLVTQPDDCVFPVSQDAMQIVGTLTRLMQQLGVKVHLRAKVIELGRKTSEPEHMNQETSEPDRNSYFVRMEGDEMGDFDAVVVTTGGSPRPSGLAFLEPFGIETVPPVPSLFTFNIAGNQNSILMGTVVEDAVVSLAGTRHKARGPLLWTHWGVSGPAVLKLSSHAARDLAASDYHGTLIVNWCGDANEEAVRSQLLQMMQSSAQKSVTNVYPTHLTQKHWQVLLTQCAIPLTQRWGALNKTHVNRLVACLTSQQLQITGRCHWKEEFVTCGGISLSALSSKTLESRQYPGLFFAGEVTDVDAVTGGFNLQAAWSMAYVVAHNVAKKQP